MYKKIEANIWKYFLIMLTSRRNYVPILGIYFLSLPNTLAQQIGLYTSLGWLAGFFLEIPSGYIADRFGYKKALIVAKFSMLISTLFFVFGNSLIYFIFGSAFIAVGFAFTSGTSSAFLHNTLLKLKKEKNYSEIDGKIEAKVSLISAAMILALPVFTKISLIMPIKIYLIFDILGVIVAFSLYTPKIEYTNIEIKKEKIFSQLKKFRGTGFYITSLFVGIMGAFLIGLTVYKELFVKSLGFPIIFIGSIMAFSRIIWFIIGHNLKFLKKIKLQKLLFYEIFLFSGFIILSSQLENPYIIGVIFATIIGYFQARKPIIQEYYINNFLINKKYKATMLSIKAQILKLFQTIFIFFIGFVMLISYSEGFLISGILMFIILISIYPFVKNVFVNKT